VTRYIRPNLPNTRIDDGITAGSTVSPYYDPMLAKVITFGANRAQAIAQMQQALEQYVVLGVKTNIHYLLGILRQARFITGNTPTSYIDEMADVPSTTVDEDVLLIAALAEVIGVRTSPSPQQTNGQPQIDPWLLLPAWRNVASA
jgi:acetyl/propionyl-CoA carboxylase alpha subunit